MKEISFTCSLTSVRWVGLHNASRVVSTVVQCLQRFVRPAFKTICEFLDFSIIRSLFEAILGSRPPRGAFLFSQTSF